MRATCYGNGFSADSCDHATDPAGECVLGVDWQGATCVGDEVTCPDGMSVGCLD